MISKNEDKRREKGTHNNDIAGGVVVLDGARGGKHNTCDERSGSSSTA